MSQLQTFKFTGLEVQCVCINSQPWFRGKDVATILGYQNTAKAILTHVHNDYKKKLEDLGHPILGCLDANAKNSIFINEPGLYSLIFKSEKAEAKAFTDWVCSEVLPSIRKTGQYTPAPPAPPPAIVAPVSGDFITDRSFTVQNETDLHSKVVD